MVCGLCVMIVSFLFMSWLRSVDFFMLGFFKIVIKFVWYLLFMVVNLYYSSGV